jgi:hypothetical protein
MTTPTPTMPPAPPTPKFETTSEIPQTTSPRTTERPEPSEEPPRRIEPEDDRINEIIPEPTEPVYIPQTPVIESRRPEFEEPVFSPPTTLEPARTEPPYKPEVSRLPEIIFNQPEPEPTYIPQPAETDRPYYYEPRSTMPTQHELPSNESIPPESGENLQPETTHSPMTSSEPPIVAPPYAVYVEVGKETATVKAEKENDGSLTINTEDIPKNEWTKVLEKPTDCQIGFELDDFGACYGMLLSPILDIRVRIGCGCK